MIPLFLSLERRMIKRMLRKADSEALTRKGLRWLLPSFRRAAQRSPAYRILLAEAGVDPASIRTPEDFVTRCPILEKANTFRRFGISELLCDDVKPDELASIITSSGHGGNGFAFGISSRKQLQGTARLIDIGLDMAFEVGSHRTLLVNCLPMGVTFQSNTVCVANVSVREDMACAIVDKAGPLFEQIVLCADPLFLKRLCDYSQDIGLDWRRFRVHVIVGEETFPETFRDYVAGVLGIDPDNPTSGLIGSSMGVGELGLNLFNETRETVALRRACIRNPALLEKLTGLDSAVSQTLTFMVFNPLRTFVEVVNQDDQGIGDLIVTVMDESAPIPLMRYATGDRAQKLPKARLDAASSLLASGCRPLGTPLILLLGRGRDRLLGGIHVDHFKAALYGDPEIAKCVSGAHRIVQDEVGLRWEVQARRVFADDPNSLSERLKSVAARMMPVHPLTVQVKAYDQFPHELSIDYERKFVYWE